VTHKVAVGPVPFVAYVGLGANLGDTLGALNAALQALQATAGVSVDAVSSVWCSRPVDAEGPDYLNAVTRLQTRLGPLELLHRLQHIEGLHGRERPFRHAPRTLDLDLLAVDSVQMDSAHLTLPHPRWNQRAFVLEPLAEVWQDTRGACGCCLPDAASRARMAAQQGIERTALALKIK